MTHPALTPAIGRDFDPFLFASIGEDRHGHLLSVISAFARSDLDPWQEAVTLARMSRETATARLSKLIAALPGEAAWTRPVDAIAGDLVALLPHEKNATVALPRGLSAALPRHSKFGWGMGALALLAMATLLLSSHSALEQAGQTHAPAATALPLSSPPAINRRL
jgi:hypothetical protein